MLRVSLRDRIEGQVSCGCFSRRPQRHFRAPFASGNAFIDDYAPNHYCASLRTFGMGSCEQLFEIEDDSKGFAGLKDQRFSFFRNSALVDLAGFGTGILILGRCPADDSGAGTRTLPRHRAASEPCPASVASLEDCLSEAHVGPGSSKQINAVGSDVDILRVRELHLKSEFCPWKASFVDRHFKLWKPKRKSNIRSRTIRYPPQAPATPAGVGSQTIGR